MIVTCTGCRTRFRVADEKVGPKGARLRCTRCKAVFSVPGPAEGPLPSTPAPTPPSAPAIAPSPLPEDPFATGPDDPFFAAVSAPVPPPPPSPAPAPAFDDDPFAAAAFSSEPSAGNSAVAEARLQAPAPGVATVPAPSAAPPEVPSPVPALDLGSLSLEESDRRAPAAPPAPFDAPEPARAPGLLDFGAFDFGDPADEPPPEPLPPTAPPADPAFALAPAVPPALDGGTDPLAGLAIDDAPRPAPTPRAASQAPAPEAIPLATPPAPASAGSFSREAAADPRHAERTPLRLRALAVNALSLAAVVIVAAMMVSSWRGRSAREFPGGSATLAARATSSGLYDTASGRPVLVVRGEVRSRAAEPVAARVRVELVDGGRVVAQAVAVPGAVPTPEEAWAVDGAPAAERLASALAARGEAHVAPGASAPFGAVLAELPPGAERFTVRVTAAPAAP